MASPSTTIRFSPPGNALRNVREQGRAVRLENPHLIEDTLSDIRKIYRDEIPDEHYVNVDGKGLVMWAEN